MNYPAEKKIYVDQIQNNFLPYWSKFVDTENGGILNCINNYGDKKISDNKFTWSEGRWLWILCRLCDAAKKKILPNVDASLLETWADGTWNFINFHSVMEDKTCCYLLTRDGKRIRDERTGRFDASIYADCFALIGSSQYAMLSKKQEAIDTSKALYESIKWRVETNNFLTEPYPIPEGYRPHGIPMILTNTVYEYIRMLEAFGLSSDDAVEFGKKNVKFVLDRLMNEEGYINEFISDFSDKGERLLDRHINPGHTIEDIWFQIEFLKAFGSLEKYLPRICKTAKQTWRLGWDSEYGGLFRFVDFEGGKPHGTSTGSQYEKLITDTWDMKLWWPHSEILYTYILLYKLTGDEEFNKIYKQSFDYIFKTFPNAEIGEWIQIRTRDGKPVDKLVALPVKDPFHILRNFIKITELI
ncbi:AGE family epimerase/isomerase [Treponema parvum]|uniref:AGE family epimerase/isomerase n=1 Tax=Treponema parvum TaxID=138851 RepID=UPI001AEC0AE7|nr:AGE family epimerase/isomerase [Treponema parvum]QTQ16410.1 AGE family epimerase/isomerase [Treponema parvum]